MNRIKVIFLITLFDGDDYIVILFIFNSLRIKEKEIFRLRQSKCFEIRFEKYRRIWN